MYEINETQKYDKNCFVKNKIEILSKEVTAILILHVQNSLTFDPNFCHFRKIP